MSQERDGSRGRPSWMAGAKPGHSLTEVEPLSILRLESVVKTYRDPMTLRPFTAVDGVSLILERGEIFGLLGPNGAGKTSTIKMILGLTRPTRGVIRIEGRDPWDPDARRKLGYLPENPCFYDHLSAMEYLELVGSLFGIRAEARRARAEALLQRLGLSAHARKPLRKFSKGMTQRVGIAQALLNEPNFLVLDEPMSGLDPIGRADVKHILREERGRGATILMTSHVLAETETLCDRVAILDHGRPLAIGETEKLVLQYGEDRYTAWTRNPDHQAWDSLVQLSRSEKPHIVLSALVRHGVLSNFVRGLKESDLRLQAVLKPDPGKHLVTYNDITSLLTTNYR